MSRAEVTAATTLHPGKDARLLRLAVRLSNQYAASHQHDKATGLWFLYGTYLNLQAAVQEWNEEVAKKC